MRPRTRTLTSVHESVLEEPTITIAIAITITITITITIISTIIRTIIIITITQGEGGGRDQLIMIR